MADVLNVAVADDAEVWAVDGAGDADSDGDRDAGQDASVRSGSGSGSGSGAGSGSGSASSSGSGAGSGAGEAAGSVVAAVRRLQQRATEDDEVARLDADLRRARRPGVLTMPDELRAGRRSVSSAAVVSLLALVVAVGCAFVLRVLWAERSASVPDVAPGPSRSVQVVGGAAATAAATSRTAAATSSSGAGEPTPTVGAELVVHVVGQVVRPGLVRLRQGARVADAITAAGGTRSGSDLAALNLARLVVDGEQIRVPRPGEAVAASGGVSGGAAGASGGGAGTGGAGSSGGSGAPVSLNSADVAALDSLPGVGPVLAQRIIDWRTEHGRFTSVDELGEVSGIGDKLMAQLRPKVTL
ncbi:helix-hairpin-helix domain-containing protein [Terrabacter tumescens]|uniref:helix-hairpin-helix domain-containing protein n=1 Tax=Terrabacter tumescens TaxID=60443 RepID=UPI001E5EE89D|nr:helix-hairpin-helix domain-containing protein [Terrabacter tumescens]